MEQCWEDSTKVEDAKGAAFAVRRRILARDPQMTTEPPNMHNITLPFFLGIKGTIEIY